MCIFILKVNYITDRRLLTYLDNNFNLNKFVRYLKAGKFTLRQLDDENFWYFLKKWYMVNTNSYLRSITNELNARIGLNLNAIEISDINNNWDFENYKKIYEILIKTLKRHRVHISDTRIYKDIEGKERVLIKVHTLTTKEESKVPRLTIGFNENTEEVSTFIVIRTIPSNHLINMEADNRYLLRGEWVEVPREMLLILMSSIEEVLEKEESDEVVVVY